MRRAHILIIVALLVAGCSGDADPEPTDGAATTQDVDAETDDVAADDAETEQADADAATEDAAAVSTQGGRVTIGNLVYQVVPDIQCLVRAEQVSIAGNLGPLHDGEFTFDMFSPGDYGLQVTEQDTDWSAQSDAIDVEVLPEEGRVTGQATVTSMIGGEEATADFDITC